MKGFLRGMTGLPVSVLILFVAGTARSDAGKVYIGLNAEAGHLTGTSDDAIRQGIRIAIDEINRSGVLEWLPLIHERKLMLRELYGKYMK